MTDKTKIDLRSIHLYLRGLQEDAREYSTLTISIATRARLESLEGKLGVVSEMLAQYARDKGESIE